MFNVQLYNIIKYGGTNRTDNYNLNVNLDLYDNVITYVRRTVCSIPTTNCSSKTQCDCPIIAQI